MYENTTADAHRMAAELIDGGRGAAQGLPRLYEDLPVSGCSCFSARWQACERYDDGAVTLAHLDKGDYEETGALETDSEGVVDHLRAVEGTKVAVLVRELLGRRPVRDAQGEPSRHRRQVDVSSIARAFGGGGHPQAAGFSTAVPYPELVDQLRGHVRDQLPARWTLMDGVLLRAKPAGVTSHDVVARVRRSLGRAGPRWATPGRSTRSRRACCSCSWAAPPAPSASSWPAEDLSSGGAARLDLGHR